MAVNTNRQLLRSRYGCTSTDSDLDATQFEVLRSPGHDSSEITVERGGDWKTSRLGCLRLNCCTKASHLFTSPCNYFDVFDWASVWRMTLVIPLSSGSTSDSPRKFDFADFFVE